MNNRPVDLFADEYTGCEFLVYDENTRDGFHGNWFPMYEALSMDEYWDYRKRMEANEKTNNMKWKEEWWK
jgi:hypothetical protein